MFIHVKHISNSTPTYDPFEFNELISSLGKSCYLCFTVTIRSVNPKYFFSSGIYNQIQELINKLKIKDIFINTNISARHQSLLEKNLKCKITDRTQLILRLFELRAQSYEGKLQVTLANYAYLSTRLVKGWTHLERQRGGIGLRGGPGETQLEIDRRILNNKIKSIKDRISKLDKHRTVTQKKRSNIFKVNLVGYSNAGKSTLFEYLTKRKTYHDDRLFATLDPLSSKISNGSKKFILTDTVGFIEYLPDVLLDAFISTLREIELAQCIVHVVDSSNVRWSDHVLTVNETLKKLRIGSFNSIMVFNKCDCLTSDEISNIKTHYPDAFMISAETGEQVDILFDYILSQIEDI